jgi:hypothetical protein
MTYKRDSLTRFTILLSQQKTLGEGHRLRNYIIIANLEKRVYREACFFVYTGNGIDTFNRLIR